MDKTHKISVISNSPLFQLFVGISFIVQNFILKNSKFLCLAWNCPLFFILYLMICFWIDWVHVYKYTKIKVLDSKEITSLPESKKKSDEHGMSFQSSLKIYCTLKTRLICIQWKFTTPNQLASFDKPPSQSFLGLRNTLLREGTREEALRTSLWTTFCLAQFNEGRHCNYQPTKLYLIKNILVIYTIFTILVSWKRCFLIRGFY